MELFLIIFVNLVLSYLRDAADILYLLSKLFLVFQISFFRFFSPLALLRFFICRPFNERSTATMMTLLFCLRS